MRTMTLFEDGSVETEYFDLQKGDVIRCMYGDYGNFVVIEVEKAELQSDGWVRCVGKNVRTGLDWEGYSLPDNKFKLIGRLVDEAESC